MYFLCHLGELGTSLSSDPYKVTNLQTFVTFILYFSVLISDGFVFLSSTTTTLASAMKAWDQMKSDLY